MSTHKQIQLTERDQKLIRTLFEYGVLTSRQIGSWFFNGIQKTTVLRRLRLLQKGKYIRKRGTLNDGTAVFMTGENGIQVTGEKLPFTTYPNFLLEHEIQIGNLRWFLEGAGAVKSWMTERALRSEIAIRHSHRDRSKFIVPDALILFRHFQRSDAKVALEMELHLKSNSRYREKFRRMDESPVFTWYVTKTISMAIKLLNLVNQYAPSYAKDGVGVSILEEIEAHKLDAKLYRINDAKKLYEVMHLKEPPAQAGAQTLSRENESKIEKLTA